jgi:hypothetical protein
VILLDADGRAIEAANVQLAPEVPMGRIVPLDADRAARGVRFRRWDLARREAGDAAAPFTDQDDVLSGQDGDDFLAPYPASVFKLLVAFHVARRVASGDLTLDEPVPAGPDPAAEWRPLSEWLELMITRSDNPATRAILRHLHARGEVDRMNAELADLGLGTLRVEGTRPDDGSRWLPGQVNVTAMDAARLLWLVAGGPGVLWRTPAGRPVTRAALPEAARTLLLRLLADQSKHDVLSSGSVCGARPDGIPALVPDRFLDATGEETAGEASFGHDVRPCQAAAEVRFLHKTGLTWNYAADAGIVESLPGARFRRYVVVLLASAGIRYLDPDRAFDVRSPCEAEQVCGPGALARIGAAVDEYAARAARPPVDGSPGRPGR